MTEIRCFFYIFGGFCKDVPTVPQEMYNIK